MSSIRQINAARANGALSRGPRTPEGLAAASRNAIRHGLHARDIVLSTESAIHFKRLRDEFLNRFQPADVVELAFVDEMIASAWRLRRVWAVETRALENELPTPDARFSTPGRRTTAAFVRLSSNSVARMDHYETRQHRTFQRALANLLLIRKNSQNEPSPTIPISAHMPPQVPALPMTYEEQTLPQTVSDAAEATPQNPPE